MSGASGGAAGGEGGEGAGAITSFFRRKGPAKAAPKAAPRAAPKAVSGLVDLTASSGGGGGAKPAGGGAEAEAEAGAGPEARGEKRKSPSAAGKATHSFFKPRKKVAATTATSEAARDPKIIAAWNANGLANRLRYNGDAIAAFLARESPDVLFVSETKLRASSRERRHELCLRDKRGIDESKVLRSACESGCLQTHAVVKLSLCDRRYAGTAMFVRKAGPRPIRIWFGLPDPETMDKVPHNEDGRIILLEWKSIMTLHTYSPNNGWTIESFARRRAWDEMLTTWLQAMHRRDDRKPVVYTGDMNAAPEDRDVSDAAWFNAQGDPPASCDPGDVGQPGCTNNEQLRFKRMAEAGNLVDAYRYVEETMKITRPSNVDAPIFTWRGHPGIDRPEAGRFYKKGMRIDHFLVDRSLLSRVRRVEICGRGLSAQDPSFLGSDHCPILLELAEAGETSSTSTGS